MDLKKKIKGFFSMTRKANDGFTLAELVVVIAILAILAGVSVAAYNGYIEKANRAADERLLAVVNRAYAAACVDYGQDSLVTPGTARLQGEAGSKTVKQVTSYYDQTGTSFAKYFADNEDSVFKVFQHLIWKDGVFVNEEGSSFEHKGKSYEYQSSDIQAYLGSNFEKIGVEATFELMDNLVNMLATVESNPIASLLAPVEGKDENGEEVMVDNEFKTYLKENGFMQGDEIDNRKVAAGLVFYAADRMSTVSPDEISAAMTGNAVADLNNLYKVISGGEKPTFADKAVAAATMYALSASFAESDYNTGKVATPDGNDKMGSEAEVISYLMGCYGYEGYKEYLDSDEVAKDMAGFVGVLRTVETNDEDVHGLINKDYKFANRDMDKVVNGILTQERPEAN